MRIFSTRTQAYPANGLLDAAKILLSIGLIGLICITSSLIALQKRRENSILFGHQIYALPIYPYVRTDLLTVLCLMYHHITIGGFLIIGAFTHASIFIIGDHIKTRSLNHIFSGRDVMISWLIYLGIALGLHSFSLYIHNDTLSTFEREEDMFRDNGIQLKPVFAISYQSCLRILRKRLF